MTETGWIPGELPAGREARELAEILLQPPTYAERQKARREQARQDERLARARDTADGAETVAFMARLRGEDLPGVGDVLGRSDAALPADRERRHRAREILRQHGLEDVLGSQSGVIFDANVGVLEPVRDVARPAGDLDFETGQALQRAAEVDRWMTGYVARSATRSGRPKGVVRRSEPVTCQDCLSMGATESESFAIHHPSLLPPSAREPVEVTHCRTCGALVDWCKCVGGPARRADEVWPVRYDRGGREIVR